MNENAMKLAEALILRADLQKRVGQLRERLAASAAVQEGEAPPEEPDQLFAELERLGEQLEELIGRINRTNLQATLPDGTTITDALARRDVLRLQHGVLLNTIAAATETATGLYGRRYSRSEIKTVPTIDVAARRRQADRIAEEIRVLDTAVQATNWAVDLVA
jgi:hypothetical protein